MRKRFGTTSAVSTAALLTLVTVPATSLAQDKGELTFNNHCRTCHSIKEGDNRLGPSLANVFGKKAGTASGYPNYSQGLTSSDVVWNEATLDKFIESPDSVVPNNNMKPYTGLTDAAVRKQIVDFLKSKSKAKGS